MGCCNHKQKFSYITKQDEMTDHLIKEKERIKEDLAELEKRHLLSITDSLTVKSNSELEKQMKLISEVSEEKQKRKSLNEFIKGLDEIEIELKIKFIKDIANLGILLDKYFELDKKEEERIKKERGVIRDWIKDNSISK